jgi:Na+-driven multidrug efflux pump
MVAVCSLYFLEGLFETLAGALQGIKVSIAPTVAIVFSICGLRLLWIFLVFPLPHFHSITGLYTCYPISWMLVSLILGGMIWYYYRRLLTSRA